MNSRGIFALTRSAWLVLLGILVVAVADIARLILDIASGHGFQIVIAVLIFLVLLGVDLILLILAFRGHRIARYLVSALAVWVTLVGVIYGDPLAVVAAAGALVAAAAAWSRGFLRYIEQREGAR